MENESAAADADAIAAIRRECDEAHELLMRRQDDAKAAYDNLLAALKELTDELAEWVEHEE